MFSERGQLSSGVIQTQLGQGASLARAALDEAHWVHVVLLLLSRVALWSRILGWRWQKVGSALTAV